MKVTRSQMAAAVTPETTSTAADKPRMPIAELALSAWMWPWNNPETNQQVHEGFMRLNPLYRAAAKKIQAKANEDFMRWVKSEGLDTGTEDGTSVAGHIYSHQKKTSQASMGMIAEPLAGIFKHHLMNNPQIQSAMRGNGMAQYFEMVAKMVTDNYPDDHGLLFEEQYNHKFLTEDSHGNIVPVSDEDIVKLFPQHGRKGDGKGQRFPHILLTSSHAQGESLSDVTAITHGIEALARDSEGKGLDIGYIDKGVKPGQTLILYACDVQENPFLNAASLLRRVNELKRIEKTGEPDIFKEISPGAQHIAKLMLKCMVAQPSLIEVNDPRAMGEVAQDRTAAITLRPDVEEVAHYFQLDGYSKGGNVVSDAARFMVAELTAVKGDGQQVFAKDPRSKTGDPHDRSMSERNVRNIMCNIAVMAKASVETGMSDYYKRHGVRRVSINNQHDLISAHQNYESSAYDERWIIKGVEHNVGHDPRHMMGMREPIDGYDDIRGYAHDDARVARRLKEYYAPNYGKVAIGHLKFDRSAQGEVIIEAATGTTDAQLWAYEREITKAFTKAGLKKVQFIDNTEDPGIFTMKCAADLSQQPQELVKFRRAFAELKEKAKGLLITQNIDEEILGQIARATPPVVDGKISFGNRTLTQSSPIGASR